MSHVHYTAHLQLRLQIGEIPEDYPRLILDEPDEQYHDSAEDRLIAVKHLHYNGRVRPMMIVYEERGGRTEGDRDNTSDL